MWMRHTSTWMRISAMAGRSAASASGSPQARRACPHASQVYGVYLYNEGQVRLWPYRRANGEHTIEVLQRLRAEVPERPLIVLWDGAPYHRAKAVREAATALNIRLMPLPSYSPDLMPVAGRGALALAARGRHVPSLPYQRRGPAPAGGGLRGAPEPRPLRHRRPPLGQGPPRPRRGETALLKLDVV